MSKAFGRVVAVIAMIAVMVLVGNLLVPAHDTRMILHSALGMGKQPEPGKLPQRIRLPAGFAFTDFARVDNARALVVTAVDDLIVSQPRHGRIVLQKRDANGDGRADGARELLKELNRPNGLALWNNYLYIAEVNAIGRVGFDATRGEITGSYARIIEGLPDTGNHRSKSISIGPDNKLYVSIGSSCNACEEEDGRRAAIMQFDTDGKNGRLFATGLRNSVGMAWAPWDSGFYATDNGRDLLGDDLPPCELNRIVDGGFYGWPYFYGNNVVDPDLGSKAPKALEPIKPVFGFRAHNAPLGMTFLNASKWPADFERAALVGLHGSWNRSSPDGYKVVSLHWTADGSVSARDFMIGFEQKGEIIGRPVDIAQAADGCVFVSDDFAGMIYRVCPGS
jgi:glucose/arabinose dehydrogenase